MIRLLLILLLLATPASAWSHRKTTIQYDGLVRTYYTYAPQRDTLIIALHGAGGTARGFVRRSGLRGVADRLGASLAAPEGVSGRNGKQSWNANSITPSGYAEIRRVNDVGFLEEIIRRSGAKRVFVVGLSKGGMLAYQMACLSDVDGVVVVSGTMSSRDCPGAAPLLQIHGQNDTQIPIEGNSQWQSISVGLFRIYNNLQCFGYEDSVRDGLAVRDFRCPKPFRLVIFDGGHTWPDFATDELEAFLGD